MAKHSVFTLDYIKNLSKDYHKGRKVSPQVYEGVEYYCVGRNSSHEFYLGIREDGTTMRYSSGEGADIYNEKGEWNGTEWDRRVSELTPNDFPYLGHF